MSEMTAKQYLETEKRMCDSYTGCTGCPFINKRRTCREFRGECPDEAISIVRKWGEEHPVKTLMDKFFEVFPNAPKSERGDPKTFCPRRIGYKDLGCGKSSDECLKCWSQPYVEPKE